MFCTKCGKEQKEGALFCVSCGNKFQTTPQDDNKMQPMSSTIQVPDKTESITTTKTQNVAAESKKPNVLWRILKKIFKIWIVLLIISVVIVGVVLLAEFTGVMKFSYGIEKKNTASSAEELGLSEEEYADFQEFANEYGDELGEIADEMFDEDDAQAVKDNIDALQSSDAENMPENNENEKTDSSNSFASTGTPKKPGETIILNDSKTDGAKQIDYDPDGGDEVGDYNNASSNSDYILPESDSKYLTQNDLKGLTADECRLARNEIYARHGRKFADEELQEYFDSKSWYTGKINPDDFKESMLSDIELSNRDAIVEFEKKSGYR